MKTHSPTLTWTTLYRIGGVAAVIAALIFRRNLGAEISLFSGQMPPVTAADWLALLDSDPLLGLAYLNLFDVVNYLLVGVIFVALYPALRRADAGAMLVAVSLAVVGVAVYVASNQACAMLSLSGQYAAADEAGRSAILAASQALLAIENPGVVRHGTGVHAALFLVTAAGLITSLVMWRSAIFNRATATLGLIAHVLLLGVFILLVVAPSLVFIPHVLAAIPLVIWQLLIARRLFQLAWNETKGDTDAR